MQHTVLFVCVHNSARSQMAEAFLNELGQGQLIAESAGLEPGKMNPNVVEVMKEHGIDLSKKATQSVFDLFKTGKKYDAVITVCDGAERCPVFPGKTKRIAWTFPDPSTFTGTHEVVLKQTRAVRDSIKEKITEFIHDAQKMEYWF